MAGSAVGEELVTHLKALSDLIQALSRGHPGRQAKGVGRTQQEVAVEGADHAGPELVGLQETQSDTGSSQRRQQAEPVTLLGRCRRAIEEHLVESLDEALVGRAGNDQGLGAGVELSGTKDGGQDLLLAFAMGA